MAQFSVEIIHIRLTSGWKSTDRSNKADVSAERLYLFRVVHIDAEQIKHFL
jgi:hypothetical protein